MSSVNWRPFCLGLSVLRTIIITLVPCNGPLTRCVKLWVAYAPGILGMFSSTPNSRETASSRSGMHHGTCVTHVPWCMSGSLTRAGGEKVPGIPGACVTRNFTYLTRGPCAVSDPQWRSFHEDIKYCKKVNEKLAKHVWNSYCYQPKIIFNYLDQLSPVSEFRMSRYMIAFFRIIADNYSTILAKYQCVLGTNEIDIRTSRYRSVG